jgi:hypothetical protein
MEIISHLAALILVICMYITYKWFTKEQKAINAWRKQNYYSKPKAIK